MTTCFGPTSDIVLANKQSNALSHQLLLHLLLPKPICNRSLIAAITGDSKTPTRASQSLLTIYIDESLSMQAVEILTNSHIAHQARHAAPQGPKEHLKHHARCSRISQYTFPSTFP